jgi:hypothetical protein
MGDQAQMQTVAMKLRPSEHYFIGGMLMLRERLTRVQWSIFESTADAICVLRAGSVDRRSSEIGGLGQPSQGRSGHSAVT